jgi:steroid delta-isomerase-like uncharacterized protein
MNTSIAVFSIAVLVIIAGCGRQRIEGTESANDENRAIAYQWIEEGFNTRNLAVVDELFAERFSVNGQIIGRDGLKRSMTRYLTSFPDLRVTIDDVVAEGNKVGIWYTVEGTHRGEFESIAATGNHVKWSGSDLLTVEHGKISQARFLSDFFGLMTQLGARLENPD